MTTRRLAAILVGDVVGFFALMGKYEESTLARVKSLRHEVNEHHGRINTTGWSSSRTNNGTTIILRNWR